MGATYRKRRLSRFVRRMLAVTLLVLFGVASWRWGAPLLRFLVPMKMPEWKSLDAADRATAIGQFRIALAQILAAGVAGMAILYAARNYQLSQRGQVTERFAKALERLGSDKIYVRAGGVLALEQLMRDAPDHALDAIHVLEAFLRHEASRWGRAPGGSERLLQPNADVQAAVTALTRPTVRQYAPEGWAPDLQHLHLVGVHLEGADLRGAQMCWTNLSRASLANADLTGAVFEYGVLVRASCRLLILTRANLRWADLENSQELWTAELSGAFLDGAVLSHTGVTVEQLIAAKPTRSTTAVNRATEEDPSSEFPWREVDRDLIKDPRVAARIEQLVPGSPDYYPPSASAPPTPDHTGPGR
ncbi:pentapeptide repeat-containing protein [Streptomyces chartreusis]|uniref:pentapeptide repeat-containing protein n=1 Tax=Streptomyces chartreusis TaxID=1969 RepID=UPI00399C1440